MIHFHKDLLLFSVVALGAVLYVSEVELGDEINYLHSEGYDTERPVYMDGRGHPEDGEPTIQGHSIGWWEDDTLVVDTANFAYHPYLAGSRHSGFAPRLGRIRQ